MNELLNAGHQFVVISKEDFDAIVADAVLARLSSSSQLEAARGKTLMPQENVESEYLTREETAAMLHVTFQTLYNWAKGKYLVPCKVGKRVLYKRAEVLAVIEKGGGRAA